MNEGNENSNYRPVSSISMLSCFVEDLDESSFMDSRDFESPTSSTENEHMAFVHPQTQSPLPSKKPPTTAEPLNISPKKPPTSAGPRRSMRNKK